MENNDLSRKINDLGKWIAGHDEELDKLKQLVDSKDKNIVRYIDKQLDVLVNNLSYSLVTLFMELTNPKFAQDLTNEMNEMSSLARKEGMSLKDYRLKLIKNGTLPKHLKALETMMDALKEIISGK